MSNPSLTRSTLRQVSSLASGRITQNLVSSIGSIAAVGLLTAVITLAFTVWLGFELRYQSKTGAPLARAAVVINSSLHESLAALRGWVAYGQDSSRSKRRDIWSEKLEPGMQNLETLATRANDPTAVASVMELRSLLRELKQVQWTIEDVANTPGNKPASVAYTRQLRPLRDNILDGLEDAIAAFNLENADKVAIEFLSLLAGFRSDFTRADLAFSNFLIEADGISRYSVDSYLVEASAQAQLVRERYHVLADSDLRSLVEFAMSEFTAYEMQAAEILNVPSSASWNVALDIFIREAVPLIDRAQHVSGELAENQSRAAVERSDNLTKASYFVIAAALLMGLIALGSLRFSFRLKSQVNNVLKRAKSLGQYDIEKCIGRGGMGEVYLAHHAMLRRPTAIKLLRPGNAQNVQSQNMLQNEVQMASQLGHPNTIEIFDYGRTSSGIFYYAMEYLDGFNLNSLVSLTGPVEPSRAVAILLQVCGSLQEAHDKGFLHRDIKPANVMLTEQGGVADSVKVLDFGLGQNLNELRIREEPVPGTPMYLAPECILGPGSASPLSDIYALGSLAYFMLCGEALFESSDVEEVLRMQIEEHPRFPSERLKRSLPEDLEYIVMACLSKNPAERPQSASHLAALLRECEIPQWTEQQARQWWHIFGESARNTSPLTGADIRSAISAIEFELDDSRL